MTNSIHHTGRSRAEVTQRRDEPTQDLPRPEAKQDPEQLLCQFKQQAALFNHLEREGALKGDKQGQALRDQVNEACNVLEELLSGPLAEEQKA